MKRNINSDGQHLARLVRQRGCLVDALLFDISRAADAATLSTYRRDALADHGLDAIEKEEIRRAIEKRFAFLNAAAIRA
jgi:hypothetical protein